jgi:hypothetical protein
LNAFYIRICVLEFYKLEKQEQANIIWDALFVKRSPLSEACQGVITTLKELGLNESLERRDLNIVRKWCKSFTKEEYTEMVNLRKKISNLTFQTLIEHLIE